MPIGKVTAIKQYMGTEKPVEFDELKELMQQDRPGYDWKAAECAKQLGEELKEMGA